MIDNQRNKKKKMCDIFAQARERDRLVKYLKCNIEYKEELMVEFEVREEHLNHMNICHGGVISGITDIIIGAISVIEILKKINVEEVRKLKTKTLRLEVQYKNPAYLKDRIVYKMKEIEIVDRYLKMKFHLYVENRMIAECYGESLIYVNSKL